MTVMEIVLLIIGALVFAASFRVPIGKDEKITEEQRLINEEEVKKQVQLQMEEVKGQFADSLDESVSDAVERAEHSLDKLTNEKIMAVNEYSDTVLSDIHKNHEEVVFLYDMLNDKQTALKNVAIEVEQTARNVNKTAQKAKEIMEVAEAVSIRQAEKIQEEETAAKLQKEEAAAKIQKEADSGFAPLDAKSITLEVQSTPQPVTIQQKEAVKAEETQEAEKAEINVIKIEDAEVDEKAARRIPDFAEASALGEQPPAERNRNEEILALYREGKSNIEIAKQLDLGVGEVKLVIDLFKEL